MAQNDAVSPGSGTADMKLLGVLYFVLYALSILLLYTYDVRNIFYYLVIAIMAAVVLLEIMRSEPGKKHVLILLQIMLLTVNIIWGVTLKYYYSFGYTDIFGHVQLINSLINLGHVTEIFETYQPFPLWHILASIFYQISGLPITVNTICYVLSGLIFFCLPVFMYLAAINLLNNNKVALLSALIISFYPTLICYGIYSIPRSAESFFFVLLVYLLGPTFV